MEQSEGKWSSATLRVFSEKITDKDITQRLGIPATRAHAKGDLISQHHTAVWREWGWLLTRPLSGEENLEEHLKWILGVIEPRLEALKSLLGECRVDLFCGFASENGQGGFTLHSATVMRLAHLGIDVGLDLYPPQAANTSGGEDTNDEHT